RAARRARAPRHRVLARGSRDRAGAAPRDRARTSGRLRRYDHRAAARVLARRAVAATAGPWPAARRRAGGRLPRSAARGPRPVSPLRVWAPFARRVAVQLDTSRQALARVGGGWWELDRPIEPGTDYAFSLDGGPLLPDPRAERLPHGVSGPARSVEHERFAWSDAGWQPPPLAAGVVYEVHVGTFSPAGTFDGAIERLDALVELGVTHLELMPVASFAGDRGWGYDGVGLFAPHEAYGGPDGLKRLVDAAHARGLAVLLDVVYNHLGPSGNYLARFGPYFTDRYHTPWGDAPNLDGPGSDEVRRFFCDNALQWLRDYHIDGLRIDAVHALLDQSPVHLLA